MPFQDSGLVPAATWSPWVCRWGRQGAWGSGKAQARAGSPGYGASPDPEARGRHLGLPGRRCGILTAGRGVLQNLSPLGPAPAWVLQPMTGSAELPLPLHIPPPPASPLFSLFLTRPHPPALIPMHTYQEGFRQTRWRLGSPPPQQDQYTSMTCFFILKITRIVWWLRVSVQRRKEHAGGP